MNQGGTAQSLCMRFVLQVPAGDPLELAIDHRDQLFECLRVCRGPLVQQSGDIGRFGAFAWHGVCPGDRAAECTGLYNGERCRELHEVRLQPNAVSENQFNPLVRASSCFPQPLSSRSSRQPDFSPPFHTCGCGDFTLNCDFVVEAVEGEYLDSRIGPGIRSGTQIESSLASGLPARLDGANAVWDALSTFPTASTTSSMCPIFLLISI